MHPEKRKQDSEETEHITRVQKTRDFSLAKLRGRCDNPQIHVGLSI